MKSVTEQLTEIKKEITDEDGFILCDHPKYEKYLRLQRMQDIGDRIGDAFNK